ncbi:GcrA family cell cycle regulator [Brevundimonas sp.]|uniref:GcrA family cell cycle regulator n=1 Tax=Brevundimonas sp. TaxID=1871086 RepID=UPI0028AE8989|nr:GcrA family cell cycle regulator [Brevundimonas sp.]
MTHHGNNTEWPDRQVEILRKMWTEKKTATEIANCLPGKSRAAVLGKARRLGLEARDKPANFQTHTAAAQAKRKPKAPEVKRDRSTGAIVQNIAARTPPKPGPQNRPAVAFGKVEVVNAAETEKRRTAHRAHGEKIIEEFAAPANDTAIPLMERRRFQCAWPVGEPERPAQQMCCGLPVQEGVGTALESYCAAHQQRAASAYQPIRREIKAPVEYRRPARQSAPASIWDGGRAA